MRDWSQRVAEPGPDGALRCPWASAASARDYIDYHDSEWGRPVHGDRALLERLVLEGFQSGLSWLTILRKRPAFRRAFADFVPEVVAQFDERDLQRLLSEEGIVRHRRKIEAAITNARATAALGKTSGDGALDRLVWSYAESGATDGPRALGDVPTSTPASVALTRELKALGFAFVGPTTVYATMQACGLVNDHLLDCSFR